MKKILELMLLKVSKKLKEQGLSIVLTESAKEFLLEKGFDVSSGARPLERTIQHYLEDAIAEEILSKKIIPGTSPNELTEIYGEFDQESKKLFFTTRSIPKVVTK
jgi:ATP-dependent Clp protease ATP-binding subunit ClpC